MSVVCDSRMQQKRLLPPATGGISTAPKHTGRQTDSVEHPAQIGWREETHRQPTTRNATPREQSGRVTRTGGTRSRATLNAHHISVVRRAGGHDCHATRSTCTGVSSRTTRPHDYYDWVRLPSTAAQPLVEGEGERECERTLAGGFPPLTHVVHPDRVCPAPKMPETIPFESAWGTGFQRSRSTCTDCPAAGTQSLVPSISSPNRREHATPPTTSDSAD